MSVTAPPPYQPADSPKRLPGPLTPPDSEFWKKYSPHYEFPLSSIGSVALHIGAILAFIAVIWLLARMTNADRQPARMIALSINDEDGNATSGRGSARDIENLQPTTQPETLKKPVEEKPLDPVLRNPLRPVLPDVSDDSGPSKVADLPNLDKTPSNLKTGKGASQGKGNTDTAGAGTGQSGDPDSHAARSVRWELVFQTSDGRDYLRQLAAMKATLVIPNEDGQSNLVYKNLDQPKPTVEQFNKETLLGLYFVDNSAESADRIAKALGLNHSPKQFIGVFPADIEEDLAKKERAFLGRKAGEIISTTFKVLYRDGKYTIRVTDQVPVKR